MASFVLPHHANAETLRQMLQSFRARIHKHCDTVSSSSSSSGSYSKREKEVAIRDFLEQMNELAVMGLDGTTTQKCIFYWPLTDDRFKTKQCLIDKSGTHNIHLVSMPALVAKIHPVKNKFSRCECTSHAPRIRLNWQEFVYPQFVELLFKRLQLPSNCPSPTAQNVHCIINEKMQFSMEIDKHAAFLKEVANDVFRVPCSELVSKYKNRHLHLFGRENVETDCHFWERHVTKDNYKLLFKLTDAKIQAKEIKGGGRVSLKATHDKETPYIVLASNFHVTPGEGKPHYRVYVMEGGKHHHSALAFYEGTRIKSSMLCHENALCMIVSSSPLTLDFDEACTGFFALATPARCRVSLRDCHLELWTKDHSHAWPLQYEITGDLLKTQYTREKLGQYYGEIHARYHAIFNETSTSTEAMIPPAHGYVVFRVEQEVSGAGPNMEVLCRSVIKHEPLCFNQYGSNKPFDNLQAGHPSVFAHELCHLRVYFKSGSDGMPSFWNHANVAMTVIEETYYLHRVAYKIHGICGPGEKVPWCYFYVNRERTYMLFIPVK